MLTNAVCIPLPGGSANICANACDCYHSIGGEGRQWENEKDCQLHFL